MSPRPAQVPGPAEVPGTGLLPAGYEVWLGSVLPAVGRSLGADLPDPVGPGFELPPARSAVVVLVDGLGAEQLRRRGGHAPFLRTLASPAGDLTCGFPSTTATSTAGLATGLTPGAHGLVGWQTLMPGTDRLVNHLSWEGGPDPLVWQPHPTLFEVLEAQGVAVTRVGPVKFDGSGLTRATLRGGAFVGADTIQERVAATVAVLRAAGSGPALVFCYFGEVDRAGHVHGPDAWQWGEQVEELDAALADLAAALPAGTSLTITADHGMVEAPESDRLDLAWQEDLDRGIRHLGGEPRSPQPYCEPGAAADVLETWRAVLQERAVVLSRDEAIAEGWFGPVAEEVRPRIGDLVVAMRGSFTVLDSRALRPQVVGLKGHHGSLTPAETLVPLLHRPA